MAKDYVTAIDYYEKGITFTKKTGMRQRLLRFLLLVSEIYYHEKKYLRGIKNANKAIKMAKETGLKDLYAEALLIKAKNEIKLSVLSKIEILQILEEAKRLAEGIVCPELLWKIYFAYGRFLQDNNEYLTALEYYQRCNRIFGSVCKKLKKESYKKSYLSRPDRESVITCAREIEKSLD